MSDFSRDERLIVDYLLGNLPDAESGHLDELSVADDEFAEFLEHVENDLIDDYVRDELPEEQRARFESYYLAFPERSKRVAVAQTFLRYVDSAKGPIAHTEDASKTSAKPARRPWHLEWGSIAAVLLISMIASYFLIKNIQLQDQISSMKKERAILEKREDQLQQDLAQQRSLDRQKQTELAATRQKLEALERADQRAAPPKLLAFHLSPQHREMSPIPKIKIAAATESVVVTVKLESDDFPLYKTVLKNAATDEILWRSGEEKSIQNSVVVQFPANLLKSQEYILEVFGVSKNGKREIISGYPFDALIQ